MRLPLLALALLPSIAIAETSIVVDRAVVRFYAPETGGVLHPRFVTARILAFETRMEAMVDNNAVGFTLERYRRTALEHHMTEDMLASLALSDPQMAASETPELFSSARLMLVDYAKGEDALAKAMQESGIDEEDLTALCRRMVRAAVYIDRAVSPILTPREEELREAYRTASGLPHHVSFASARPFLERTLIYEHLRAAESAFYQAAHGRLNMVLVGEKEHL